MDKAEIDESGRGLQFFCKCLVQKITKIEGQSDVYALTLDVVPEHRHVPKPGQFCMLRSVKSSVEYNRPISVYHCEECVDKNSGIRVLKITFLILKKGRGTEELCTSLPGDELQVIGPLGNGFEIPEGIKTESAAEDENPEICIIGGGIGVAPVANFASSLKEKSYDFFAAFRMGSYGLEYVKAHSLEITTDRGDVGIKGMLPEVFTADTIRKRGYKVIYACGPTPMLVYVQTLAREAGIKCFISMESRMLCGVGACLGCSISTVSGGKRVCKDGPVFDASQVLLDMPPQKRKPIEFGKKPKISVDIAGVHFENPIIAAGGTFGYGQNYRGIIDVNDLGGIVSKGITLEMRRGNAGNRVIEVVGGNINSIGLENPGVSHFIEHELPDMLALKPVTIVNLAGSDLDSYIQAARLLDETDVQMIELNISCPNVKAGGMAWGTNPDMARKCVSAVRQVTRKPLMVKLSPNAPDLIAVAFACIEAGADALSLINSIQAVSIDIESGKPFFDNVKAGLSGPAVKPIALRMVYDLATAINKLPSYRFVPIVGMGGISCWQDAVEFIMAGASAIQVGSAKFSNPNVMGEIVTGLEKFMASHGYHTIEEMRGVAQITNQEHYPELVN